MQVETYTLRINPRINGRNTATYTKVVLEDGREIKFLSRLSKREAIRQAQLQIDRGRL